MQYHHKLLRQPQNQNTLVMKQWWPVSSFALGDASVLLWLTPCVVCHSQSGFIDKLLQALGSVAVLIGMPQSRVFLVDTTQRVGSP